MVTMCGKIQRKIVIIENIQTKMVTVELYRATWLQCMAIYEAKWLQCIEIYAAKYSQCKENYET